MEKSASISHDAEVPGRRDAALKTALFLSVLTIAYNVTEGVVSVFFGVADESLTLAGFGFDSFIEVISGTGILHMVWRMQHSEADRRDSFERRALRITGTAFYLLCGGLAVSAVHTVYSGHRPESTAAGTIISILSILLMVILARAKTNVGKALDSEAILADAQCTKVCIYMSLVLLAASGLYFVVQIPFVDAAGCAGLAFLSFREGRECFEKAASDRYCSCG